MSSKRVKIYNDVDTTCYEIIYYKNNRVKSLVANFDELKLADNNITDDDILKRITKDVIDIALRNKTRSANLSFENLKFEANDDCSEVRFYTQDKKCFGYLNVACSHCLNI